MAGVRAEGAPGPAGAVPYAKRTRCAAFERMDALREKLEAIRQSRDAGRALQSGEATGPVTRAALARAVPTPREASLLKQNAALRKENAQLVARVGALVSFVNSMPGDAMMSEQQRRKHMLRVLARDLAAGMAEHARAEAMNKAMNQELISAYTHRDYVAQAKTRKGIEDYAYLLEETARACVALSGNEKVLRKEQAQKDIEKLIATQIAFLAATVGNECLWLHGWACAWEMRC